ncbi:type I methionyl aminopeptidase [soil metagenome]
MGLFGESIEIKTPAQMLAMRRAGLIVGRTLAALREAARPGVSTAELDAIAEDSIRAQGGIPSFKGYAPFPPEPPFPATICASVNDEVVHGIPGERVLAEGDIVSIDCGAIVEGFHGDAALTVAVGEVSLEVAQLLQVTEESMWRGIAAVRAGGRIGDISHAVSGYLRGRGRYGIVEEFTGHGIGSSMHMAPDVPNVGKRGKGPTIAVGMGLAIEPMATLGTRHVAALEDGWTIVTEDGSWAAHFENTVVVTETGLWVTTALDGGRDRLTQLGLPFGGPEDDPEYEE